MVYQDYELVATKRAGHSRQKGFLLMKQQFNAMGGFNTVYLATFCGMAGSVFGLTSSAPVVKPLMSGPGMFSFGSNALLKSGPAIAGLLIGIGAFGNRSELY